MYMFIRFIVRQNLLLFLFYATNPPRMQRETWSYVSWIAILRQVDSNSTFKLKFEIFSI